MDNSEKTKITGAFTATGIEQKEIEIADTEGHIVSGIPNTTFEGTYSYIHGTGQFEGVEVSGAYI